MIEIPDEFAWAQNTLPWCFRQQLPDGRFLGAGRDVPVIDTRLEFAKEYVDFNGCKVLEAGCCEAQITTGLCNLGAKVTTFDARLPNVLKTICRLKLAGYDATVLQHNADKIDELGQFDVVVHFGVFYHLANPFKQLEKLANVTDNLLLDTHTAIIDKELTSYEDLEGHWWKESPNNLWGGMQDESFWLTVDSLKCAAKIVGFSEQTCLHSDDEATCGPRSLWLLQK